MVWPRGQLTSGADPGGEGQRSGASSRSRVGVGRVEPPADPGLGWEGWGLQQIQGRVRCEASSRSRVGEAHEYPRRTWQLQIGAALQQMIQDWNRGAGLPAGRGSRSGAVRLAEYASTNLPLTIHNQLRIFLKTLIFTHNCVGLTHVFLCTVAESGIRTRGRPGSQSEDAGRRERNALL